MKSEDTKSAATRERERLLDEYRDNVRRTFRSMSDNALAFQAGRVVGGIDREELERELDRRAAGTITQRAARLGVELATSAITGAPLYDPGFVTLMLDELDALPESEREAAVAAVNDGSSPWFDETERRLAGRGFVALGVPVVLEADDARFVGESLDYLAGIDEGEHTDRDRLLELSSRLAPKVRA